MMFWNVYFYHGQFNQSHLSQTPAVSLGSELHSHISRKEDQSLEIIDDLKHH
jgi:hypothetical protein